MAQPTLPNASVAGNTTPVPFAFKDHQVRTIVDGQLWFVARDIAGALGLAWNGKLLDNIPTQWKGLRRFLTGQKNQPHRVISEPAVYKLAFRSNKPEADEFTNWVSSEVLPSIRKTGQFVATVQPLPTAPTTKLDREPLRVAVEGWVTAATANGRPFFYQHAWKIVNGRFGLKSIDKLTLEQLPAALAFVQEQMAVELARASELPAAPATPALPEPPPAAPVPALVGRPKRRGRPPMAPTWELQKLTSRWYREWLDCGQRQNEIMWQISDFVRDRGECRPADTVGELLLEVRHALARVEDTVTSAGGAMMMVFRVLELAYKLKVEQADGRA